MPHDKWYACLREVWPHEQPPSMDGTSTHRDLRQSAGTFCNMVGTASSEVWSPVRPQKRFGLAHHFAHCEYQNILAQRRAADKVSEGFIEWLVLCEGVRIIQSIVSTCMGPAAHGGAAASRMSTRGWSTLTLFLRLTASAALHSRAVLREYISCTCCAQLVV